MICKHSEVAARQKKARTTFTTSQACRTTDAIKSEDGNKHSFAYTAKIHLIAVQTTNPSEYHGSTPIATQLQAGTNKEDEGLPYAFVHAKERPMCGHVRNRQDGGRSEAAGNTTSNRTSERSLTSSQVGQGWLIGDVHDTLIMKTNRLPCCTYISCAS